MIDERSGGMDECVCLMCGGLMDECGRERSDGMCENERHLTDGWRMIYFFLCR